MVAKKTKKKPFKSKVPQDKLSCTNCEQPIGQIELDNNLGYCNECAFECWGERGPDEEDQET